MAFDCYSINLDNNVKEVKNMVYECGNKPGAGNYECTNCGKVLTLDDDTDTLPPCSKCDGCEFEKV